MEAIKHEKQRFQFSLLALVNALVAILAVSIAGFSAARIPSQIPTKPGLESQLRGGMSDADMRQTALSLAESSDRSAKQLRTALAFQHLYAWIIGALLMTNSLALYIFFLRLRGSQKREAVAYATSTALPEAPLPGPGPKSEGAAPKSR